MKRCRIFTVEFSEKFLLQIWKEWCFYQLLQSMNWPWIITRGSALFWPLNYPPVQDEIDTLVAHARNETFVLRKEKETRVSLHALSQRVEELDDSRGHFPVCESQFENCPLR